MWNFHITFVLCSASQKWGEDFAIFCGLFRIYELYCTLNFQQSRHNGAEKSFEGAVGTKFDKPPSTYILVKNWVDCDRF